MMHVDRFDPISLRDLESHAALQMRVDRKYIVDYETLERLLAELGDDYLALEIDGERLQQYDSVYFDTPELTGYRHHMQGRRKRFKCRTRLYGETVCFFDVKMKGRRGETVKSRLPLSPWAHSSLTGEASGFLKRELLHHYGYAAPASLVPTLHTSFARLALTHARRPERLTVDFGILFDRVGSGDRYRLLPDHVLIEAKSAHSRARLTGSCLGSGRGRSRCAASTASASRSRTPECRPIRIARSSGVTSTRCPCRTRYRWGYPR